VSFVFLALKPSALGGGGSSTSSGGWLVSGRQSGGRGPNCRTAARVLALSVATD